MMFSLAWVSEVRFSEGLTKVKTDMHFCGVECQESAMT